jgi:hypothetical protein
MRPETVFKLLLLLLVLAVPLALAQKAGSDTPKYDPAKEVKLKGSVEEVKEIPGPKGEVGIELVLKTGSELVEVRLCPNSFLKEFEVTFAKGDQLEITGAKIKLDEKDVVLAREIVRGPETIVLRDKQGAPVWTWLKS